MYKIAVVGDADSCLGFLALGIDIFPVDDAKECQQILRKLDSYAVIYITEQAAELAGDAINRYNEVRTPAIIPIPGITGTLGLGAAGIKKSVERAVGADILNN